MSTEAKKTRGPRKATGPIRITEAAERCSMTTAAIKSWVRKGLWPLPHSIIERTWFFHRNDVEHWIDTGQWPETAKFSPGEGLGRTISAS